MNKPIKMQKINTFLRLFPKKCLKTEILIKAIGYIEVAIGICSFLGVMTVQFTSLYGFSQKPTNVFVFVVLSAGVSLLLGVGTLLRNKKACNLLIFFSGYVILTKLLKYAGLLKFNGDLITIFPSWAKDTMSFLYHIFVISVLMNGQKKYHG